MKFTKMHGIGNDYVYVNCFDETIENKSNLAIRVSNRNFGIGSDGLICICPSDKADFRMEMYNADGSISAMCGNGIRCVGKYVYDKGLTDKAQITVETLSGIKTLWLNVEGNTVKTVRVDMGMPIFTPDYIPVLTDGKEFIKKTIEVCGITWEMTALSVGNPHAVIFIDEDVDLLALDELGPHFETLSIFPERVNTEFVNVLDNGILKMRVWERGSGETMACGTGATAVVAAASMCGYCGDSAIVKLRGGDLFIEWDKAENKLYMTGPAETVFDGVLY